MIKFNCCLIRRLALPLSLCGFSSVVFAQNPALRRSPLVRQAEKKNVQILLPASRYRVLPVPAWGSPSDCCWLDRRTMLWIFHTKAGKNVPVLMPPGRGYHRLMNTFRDTLVDRDNPHFSLHTEGSGRYILLSMGNRALWVFDRNGREQPYVERYHSDYSWSPDGRFLMTLWWGTNGNLLDYPRVSIGRYGSHTRSKTIRNDKQKTLFDGHGSPTWTFTSHKLYVMPDLWSACEGIHPQLKELSLLEQDLTRPNSRIRRRTIRLPMVGEIVRIPLFSPDAKSFVCWILPESGPYEYLCMGNIRRGLMHILARIPRAPDEEKLFPDWQPDSTRLSFIYRNQMYLLRVN